MTSVWAPLVWAHRGASNVCPENTLAAFRAALRAGADGVELDVHPSADGHVVPGVGYGLPPQTCFLMNKTWNPAKKNI